MKSKEYKKIITHTGKHYLPELNIVELTGLINDLDERSFRANQLYKWYYLNMISDYHEITEFNSHLQSKLTENLSLTLLQVENISTSNLDGTKKYLFKLYDDNMVETVFMPKDNRYTVCVSTQVGCALGCTFCATGLMGYIRNLSAGEIIDQVLTVSKLTSKKITNVVFMGMGEPFHNYDNVIKTAYILNDKKGLNIGARHITVSTVGLGNEILRYFKERHPFRLAISINAGKNSTREKIMPISNKFSIMDLTSIVNDSKKANSRKVTFEYVLMKNINDSDEEIDSFIKSVKGMKIKVNLIPYNYISAEYSTPDKEIVNKIFKKIKSAGIGINIRWSHGQDIKAGCGQLYSESAKLNDQLVKST